MFGDVKFVCMGGTASRMESFARHVMDALDYKLPTGACLEDLCKNSNRYAMYKVGPVICVSHGMGVPSLSILLHEMIKLMSYAGAKDPVFFRIGTSGGIGYEPGTVVVTSQAMDGKLQPYHENIILGKDYKMPAKLDQDLVAELLSLSKQKEEIKAVQGITICTNDFYEGQGRLDGAFCRYTNEDKMNYLKYLKKNGVANIEMEAVCFAAYTAAAGIKAAIVCVTLLDRLSGDQVTTPKETMTEWQLQPQKLVARFIKKQLTT